MREDRPESSASESDADPSAPEPVVLPEHASAYYSPRSPPAATPHRTLETAAVKLDESVDPRLADTHRMSVDGLPPPPWLSGGPGPASDAPTVLVPVVRARRRRRRMISGALAAVVGAGLGVWFGFRTEPARPSAGPVRAAASAPPASAPQVAVVTRGALQVSPPPTVFPSASPEPSSAGALTPTPAPAPATKKSPRIKGAWVRPEAPKAWIK